MCIRDRSTQSTGKRADPMSEPATKRKKRSPSLKPKKSPMLPPGKSPALSGRSGGSTRELDLEQKVEVLEAEVAMKDDLLGQREEELVDAQKQTFEAEATVTEREGELFAAQKAVVQAEADLAGREEELVARQKELAKSDAEMAEREEELVSRQKECARLDACLLYTSPSPRDS
eukprot:TRINITY_DN17463_c0_g1_i1.p2 TRINITY_DN17463_c0_g1~~TRINITY_DN17463_c0_g1_i1.p2  ORF type:complete len:174 (-),score=59.87 TRINITY_DN17463_c0_g1_i1:29-550(-)